MNQTWPRLLCAGALALTSLLAHAQYSWVDDKGMRVYSDRPPPPGTPAARILKTPRGLEPAAAAPASSTAPAAPAVNQEGPAAAKSAAKPAAPPSPTLAERDADFRKRIAERDKEEQEEAKRRSAQLADCSAARYAQQQLTTARRLARNDGQGNPQVMSDEDRTREMAKVQGRLANCPAVAGK
jgi:hypothetical protein